jgi:hypothetical protein
LLVAGIEMFRAAPARSGETRAAQVLACAVQPGETAVIVRETSEAKR